MNGTATYSEILTIIVPAITMALAVNGWFYKMINDERKDREIAVDDLAKQLHEARESRHSLSNEFFIFRERMARETVSHEMMGKFEARIIQSVDKLGERIDRVFTPSHTTVAVQK